MKDMYKPSSAIFAWSMLLFSLYYRWNWLHAVSFDLLILVLKMMRVDSAATAVHSRLQNLQQFFSPLSSCVVLFQPESVCSTQFFDVMPVCDWYPSSLLSTTLHVHVLYACTCTCTCTCTIHMCMYMYMYVHVYMHLQFLFDGLLLLHPASVK